MLQADDVGELVQTATLTICASMSDPSRVYGEFEIASRRPSSKTTMLQCNLLMHTVHNK